MELPIFFRFLPLINREERLEGTFNLVYGMNGGLTASEVKSMRRKDFNWYLERLADQKKKENQEMEKVRSSYKSQPKGKMKYLGR